MQVSPPELLVMMHLVNFWIEAPKPVGNQLTKSFEQPALMLFGVLVSRSTQNKIVNHQHKVKHSELEFYGKNVVRPLGLIRVLVVDVSKF
jgi:hypothetical protein